jgi:hypothetical protein
MRVHAYLALAYGEHYSGNGDNASNTPSTEATPTQQTAPTPPSTTSTQGTPSNIVEPSLNLAYIPYVFGGIGLLFVVFTILIMRTVYGKNRPHATKHVLPTPKDKG